MISSAPPVRPVQKPRPFQPAPALSTGPGPPPVVPIEQQTQARQSLLYHLDEKPAVPSYHYDNTAGRASDTDKAYRASDTRECIVLLGQAVLIVQTEQGKLLRK